MTLLLDDLMTGKQVAGLRILGHRGIAHRSMCYSREADRSTSRCSRTERARFRALRSSVS